MPSPFRKTSFLVPSTCGERDSTASAEIADALPRELPGAIVHATALHSSARRSEGTLEIFHGARVAARVARLGARRAARWRNLVVAAATARTHGAPVRAGGTDGVTFAGRRKVVFVASAEPVGERDASAGYRRVSVARRRAVAITDGERQVAERGSRGIAISVRDH